MEKISKSKFEGAKVNGYLVTNVRTGNYSQSHNQMANITCLNCGCGIVKPIYLTTLLSNGKTCPNCKVKVIDHELEKLFFKGKFDTIARRCKYNKAYEDIENDFQNWQELYVALFPSFVQFLIDNGNNLADLEIDRISPFGNYSPDNCRWTTTHENRTTHKRSQCNPKYKQLEFDLEFSE